NTIINSFSGADSNLNGGRVFNINTIRYTGHNNTLGDYRIVFFRKITNLKFNQEINARLGVKKIDPYLLDKIKVYNKKEIVREYQFSYNTLARFGKTLLTKVSEHDSGGNEFYNHEFEYYDDLLDDNDNEVYFSSGIDVTICNDEVQDTLTFPCRGHWGIGPDYWEPEQFLFINPTEVYINNQLIPGGPFNSIEGFVNALLIVYPEFEFAYSTITPGSFSLIACNNPSILFETITFVDILTTITHSYDFGPC